MKFLVGLLNSTLVHFWLKNKGKIQGTVLKLDKEPLMQVPIKLAAHEKQIKIMEFVDKILDVKQANPTADTTDLENQIDELVYKLYDLTAEEIQIIESATN